MFSLLMHCMNGTLPGQIPVHILTSLANKYLCIRTSLYPCPCVVWRPRSDPSARDSLSLSQYSQVSWLTTLGKLPWKMGSTGLPVSWAIYPGKTVKRESGKQLSATPLNSLNQGQIWQRVCSETRHEKNVGICLCERPVTQIDTHVTLTREYDTVSIISLVSTQCHQRMRWQIDPDKFSWSHARKTRFSVIWTWTNQLSTTGEEEKSMRRREIGLVS